MGYLKNLKLRYQLVLLIGIAIFMVILVQIIYYGRFFYMIQDKTRVYAENIIDQVNNKLESTAETTRKAASTAIYNETIQKYLPMDGYSQEKKTLNTATYDILRTILNSNSNIVDISLINNNDHIISTLGIFTQVELHELNTLYDIKNVKKPFYPPIIMNNNNFYYYYYIMPIFDKENGSRLGTCVVLSRIKYVEDIIQNTSFSKNSLFLILDSSNTIVAANRSENYGKAIDPELLGIINANNQNAKVKYNGQLSMIEYKINKEMNWKTISIIPVNELTQDLAPLKKLGIYIGIATILLLSLIGFAFIKNITNPIAKIVEMMDEIGEKNIKQRIDIKETNEVGTIANDINKMLDKIELMTKNIFNMQNRLYEMELSKKESEISSLQSQINPHFLYNTQECLRSIGNVYKAKEVVSISTAMAKIFRFSIKGSNFTTIEEEIKIIEEYLKIMKIRYMDKFSTEINIDKALLPVQTIKMILQPLVENAIYHGLEAKDGPGKLVINGIVNDGIELQVMDDGVGISQQEVDKINNRFELRQPEAKDGVYNNRSIGLSNINSRIKLYYGNQYGLWICSRENEGTKVTVKLPFKENMEVSKEAQA